MAATSMALRPRRSSLVTTRTSPVSSLSACLLNSGRWLMATLPEMVSVAIRCGSTRNPEAVISCTRFSVVWSAVETLRYAKFLATVLPVRIGCPYPTPCPQPLLSKLGDGMVVPCSNCHARSPSGQFLTLLILMCMYETWHVQILISAKRPAQQSCTTTAWRQSATQSNSRCAQLRQSRSILAGSRLAALPGRSS